MTDERGLFEHADHTNPRAEHGYCTDDVARLLVVACREPSPDAIVLRLERTALRFLGDAQGPTGAARNRMDRRGRWRGQASVEDCWGRSLWAFGTAAARGRDDDARHDALARFSRGARLRSPWRRSMAFAALGADEVLTARPDDALARALLADAAAVVGHRAADTTWPWPERRLSYANAVVPDALIAAGAALGRPALVDHGLELLAWLLDHETRDDHLSVTPVGGTGPGDRKPAFDQQPIEVAAIADACSRAWAATHDSRWMCGVTQAVDWFLGDNDARSPMWDPTTGGGYDGLHAHGPNRNEGAESTLALVSTLQHARSLAPVGT
jgi:hypothetical protein